VAQANPGVAPRTLAEHARVYSGLGWALTPLDGKAAAHPGWQRTQPLPPDTAYTTWKPREGNIGLVLGSSGIVDYEMDACDEDVFLAPLGGVIPSTPAFRTGSGKIHVLFRDPGGLTRSTVGGRELRAGGHQSAIPPSIHPDTKLPYAWLPGHAPWQVEVQVLPADVLASFRGQQKEGTGVNWLETLRSRDKLGEGQGRHASLISYLGRMVSTLETEEQLVTAALMYATETQSPMYPEEVLRKQAADVWRRYRETGELPPEEINPISAGAYLGIRQLSDIQMRSIQFVWRPYLQRSAFHLLVGQKGAGKGTLLAYWAAKMTIGELDGGTRGVLWIKTEDSFEIDVKPRFTAQGGNPDLFYAVHKRVRLPEDIPYIESFTREMNVGMIVIDPIVGVIGGADTNAESAIVAAIGGLNDIADELDLMVIGVRHLGKRLDSGALAAVLGGVAWVNTPRAVLGIAQDDDRRITLEVLAGNRTRSLEGYAFQIEEHHVDGLDENVTRVIPIGPSDKTIDEILSRPRDKKYQETRDLVFKELDRRENTPVSKAELLPLLASIGSSDRTLDRVVSDLKREGSIRWLAPPKGEDGKIQEGYRWCFVATDVVAST